jgi:subtilisin family serine protease
MKSLLLLLCVPVAIQGYIIKSRNPTLDINQLSKTTFGEFTYYSVENYPSPLNAVDYDYIYADNEVWVTQANTWHLNRVENRKNVAGPIKHNTKSSSIVYIIDTGLFYHGDLNKNMVRGPNFSGDGHDEDCNGHGTHVAGLVGGSITGYSNNLTTFSLKVLGCGGSGSYSAVLQALEWALKDFSARSNKNVFSVINMSLGGGYSPMFDDIFKNLVSQGILVVVAAGNENSDACNTSPAGNKNVLTVAASDRNDRLATFSNWGKCVNVISPGVDIWSTYLDNQYVSMSGTSMATPITVSVLASFSGPPSVKKATLMSLCSKGVVDLLGRDLVNCLTYVKELPSVIYL